jgi:uncharacterized protein YbbC (DUF1343 family)
LDLKSFFAASAILLLGFSSCAHRGASPSSAAPYKGPFMLGIDVLEAQNFRLLQGKRVGLITNHTSYNRRGQRTRVVLQRAPQVNLTALYAPEHGIDGNVKAGVHIATRRDSVTGLTVHSLYGPTRKPSPAQLLPIDLMVFDLQDIGVRSYTYISTMALAMEACAERGIPFVVLDRPNPLGGRGIYGPPLDNQWKSFVGQIPVPYVHGMTTGELAMMTNARGWITRRPQLHVVRMRGWNRQMLWNDTGLRWYPTSPNIPKPTSPLFYAMTGMLGGLMPVDIGIGTPHPFEYAAGLRVDPGEFSRTMNAYRFPGVRFEPYVSVTREGRNGSRILVHPRAEVDPVAVDVACIFELHRRVPGGLLSRVSPSGLSLFNKVYGSDRLEQALRRAGSPQALIRSWESSNARFRNDRRPYLLYP